MKKITASLVLYVVAVVLFIAAALVVDGHVDVGNASVLTDVGLAAGFAALGLSDRGY